MDFPYISISWVYKVMTNEKIAKILYYALPIGALMYAYSILNRKKVLAELEKINKVAQHIIDIVNGVDDNHQSH